MVSLSHGFRSWVQYLTTCLLANSDGTPDCTDASDEFECNGAGNSTEHPIVKPSHESNSEGHTCSENKFECGNGECIWQAWVCDRDKDCLGGEDEDETICSGRATCTTDQFRYRRRAIVGNSNKENKRCRTNTILKLSF